ncbi:SGNH/GDSL hydrolase family protein [Paenibacillus sp. ATY16]|uniref:SGNH/GDSL hydrolase family protein n=1 Tax=Paenibacillus sp. ATY16 TaxID=1759312 RepID=UPI00200D0E15|nr:SGNH/GDSL hydrolase family protein [Paenibacillus sp. ATY16]MCK9860519.1 SGNH/GDSL hydrolase family protein [Paenibacillus sp. ATY16]
MGKVILFQGDSITDCGRSRDGYAGQLLGQGYAYHIAGRLGSEQAEAGHQFINRGISGNRVSDLYARWNEDAIALKPDLLSILIGVNDTWRIMDKLPSGATDRFERAYRVLLEETKEVLPDTGLVLCEPFVLRTGVTAKEWSGWRERVERQSEVVKQLAEEYESVFVPFQQAFDQAAEKAEPDYWLFDGVHPTAAGHYLMASEWLKAVQNSPLAIV